MTSSPFFWLELNRVKRYKNEVKKHGGHKSHQTARQPNLTLCRSESFISEDMKGGINNIIKIVEMNIKKKLADKSKKRNMIEQGIGPTTTVTKHSQNHHKAHSHSAETGKNFIYDVLHANLNNYDSDTFLPSCPVY